MLLAVKVGAVATPVLSVTTLGELANAPLAPLEGAENITVAPLAGLLLASFTVAFNAVPKAVFTVVLCGVPEVAVMLGKPELPLVGLIVYE